MHKDVCVCVVVQIRETGARGKEATCPEAGVRGFLEHVKLGNKYRGPGGVKG
jgi:hypothetical protein